VKLLALVTDAFGGQGGIAQYNRDLLTALSLKAGSRLIVLPRHHRSTRSELPPGVRQLGPAGKFRFALGAIRIAATERSFDAVFCGHLT
jgi:phosphatidylinositol alpha-1,6-mannosyltransferase